MSKEDRFDIVIGILDHTENAIERIKNQHKFEKDLSEFLNTNTYSKDKYWVAGMLNQVSEYCKDKIDTLIEKDQRIAELEEQLKNAIVPKFKIGQEVWFVNELSEEIYLGVVVGFEVSKVYFGPLDAYYRIEYQDGCLITDDFEDEFVFATKEEALAKLEELKGEKK